MASPRPKTFVASVPFSIGAEHFEPGDVVEGLTLDRVLRFGDRFVTSNTTPKENPNG